MRTPKTTINRALKFAIVDSALRQRDVCTRTGITEPRLSNIIHQAGQPPSKEEKRAIAKALRVPISELFPVAAPKTAPQPESEAVAS